MSRRPAPGRRSPIMTFDDEELAAVIDVGPMTETQLVTTTGTLYISDDDDYDHDATNGRRRPAAGRSSTDGSAQNRKESTNVEPTYAGVRRRPRQTAGGGGGGGGGGGDVAVVVESRPSPTQPTFVGNAWRNQPARNGDGYRQPVAAARRRKVAAATTSTTTMKTSTSSSTTTMRSSQTTSSQVAVGLDLAVPVPINTPTKPPRRRSVDNILDERVRSERAGNENGNGPKLRGGAYDAPRSSSYVNVYGERRAAATSGTRPSTNGGDRRVENVLQKENGSDGGENGERENLRNRQRSGTTEDENSVEFDDADAGEYAGEEGDDGGPRLNEIENGGSSDGDDSHARKTELKSIMRPRSNFGSAEFFVDWLGSVVMTDDELSDRRLCTQAVGRRIEALFSATRSAGHGKLLRLADDSVDIVHRDTDGVIQSHPLADIMYVQKGKDADRTFAYVVRDVHFGSVPVCHVFICHSRPAHYVVNALRTAGCVTSPHDVTAARPSARSRPVLRREPSAGTYLHPESDEEGEATQSSLMRPVTIAGSAAVDGRRSDGQDSDEGFGDRSTLQIRSRADPVEGRRRSDRQMDDGLDGGGRFGLQRMVRATSQNDYVDRRRDSGSNGQSTQLTRRRPQTVDSGLRPVQEWRPLSDASSTIACLYLGLTRAKQPSGMKMLNYTTSAVWTAVPEDKWIRVNVDVRQTTVVVSRLAKPMFNWDVRQIKFFAINSIDRRLCGIVLQNDGTTAMKKGKPDFLVHVFYCQNSAVQLCAALRNVCEGASSRPTSVQNLTTEHPITLDRHSATGVNQSGYLQPMHA